MKKKRTFKHIFGSALLITGTSVGAGMLALPVVTGKGGFFPSIIIFFLSWLVMTISGLFYLEICATMPEGSNIISMAKKYLGDGGKNFAWIIYLFLFYCLLVAYISGGASFISLMTKESLPEPLSVIFFTFILAFFVYWGAKVVDRLNIVLMAGLIVSYLLFVVVGVELIDIQNLFHQNWKQSVFALPVILISFGYQGLIPTLTTYLHKDKKKVRLAIFIGTSLTLIIYIFWQFLILGIIPLNELLITNDQGEPAIYAIKQVYQVSSIFQIAQFFSFFAIATSFLGVSLALFDFLSDGLKIPKKGSKKVGLAALTFLPALLITLIYPKLFIIALNYAGGIGGILLLAFLPALMLYKKNLQEKELIPGFFHKNQIIYFIFIFVLLELIIEFYNEYIRFFSN